MKTKHLNTALSIITATIFTMLFNNFTFVDWLQKKGFNIQPVHEAARISHAKELLGTSYFGSDAHRIEGEQTLSEMILDKVQQSLDARHKSHALSVANTIITESTRYDFDPIFVLAIIQTESGFDPLIQGRHGEIGLMQIKPDTAKWIARKNNIHWDGRDTLKNPAANIKIGMAYMNYLRNKFKKKPVSYVSAYNMGPLNVRRLLKKNIKPAEYKGKVMKNYASFYASLKQQPALGQVASN